MNNLLPHTCKTKAHHEFSTAMSAHNTQFALGRGISFREMLKIFNLIDGGAELLTAIEKDGSILHPDTVNALKSKIV
jgi:hypothetical protein